jgi:hypothetical protein
VSPFSTTLLTGNVLFAGLDVFHSGFEVEVSFSAGRSTSILIWEALIGSVGTAFSPRVIKGSVFVDVDISRALDNK